MKEITIEDVLRKNCNDWYNITPYEAQKAMTEYASLNRQGWTRVETLLPKVNEKVLMIEVDDFDDENITIGKYTEHGQWYAPYRTRNKVTHWMPLPNKP